MSDPGSPHDDRDPPRADLRAPTQEAWDALLPAEKERWHDRLLEVAIADYEMMAEGDWHRHAKVEADETLRAFFRKTGRSLYVAAELMVVYPEERPFVPDILAVRDVDPHWRPSWLVANERRGIDFVLEIHYRRHWRKDYAENVRRYAALGIPEYFVFNCRQPSLRGWCLPAPGARAYELIHPEAGRLASHVLDLDLTVEEERLRFYHGTAPLLSPPELAVRLEQMVDTAQARADAATRGMAEALLGLLAARSLAVDDEARERILASSDVALLGRWLARAATAAVTADVFGDG